MASVSQVSLGKVSQHKRCMHELAIAGYGRIYVAMVAIVVVVLECF